MEKYTRVVRKISNDLVKLDLAYSSLEEIADNADLESLKERYFSIKEYKDLDDRGNRMYSAGFNRLIDFQNFKNQNLTNLIKHNHYSLIHNFQIKIRPHL